MAESDGGVLLDVKIAPNDASKEFNKLAKKAETLEAKLAQSKDRLQAAKYEASRLGAQLDAARAKEEQMRASGMVTTDQLTTQRETVRSLEYQFNAADRRFQSMTLSTQKTTDELDLTRKRAAQLAQHMAEVPGETNRGIQAFDQMGAAAKKVESRLKKLASRVLIFSVFTAALRHLRSWFSDIIKTDEKAVAALGQLKGALLTLVQPIVDLALPAITSFIQTLTLVVGELAKVVAKMSGTTVEAAAEAAEKLNAEKAALDGVGKSAKKAGKQMAGFDEINKIGGDTSSESASTIDPTFGGLEGGLEGELNETTALVSGAVLALGALLTFTGANIPLGLGLMALGAAGLAATVSANWETIVEALRGPIGEVVAAVIGALLALGAVLAFSGVNLPLGIGLMIAGAVGLAAEVALNWDTIVNALGGVIDEVVTVIRAGVLAIGAILAFSGTNLPLGIGLMIAGAAGLAEVAALNWDTISDALKGPIGEVVAAVSGALLVLGVILAFSGTNLPLGIGLMIAGAVGLAAVTALNWDTIVNALSGVIDEVVTVISVGLLAIGAILAFSGTNLPLGIGLMIAGAVGLAAVTALNWDTISDALKGPIGAVVAVVSGALLVLGVILAFTGVALPLGVGLIAAGAVGLGTTMALNWDYLLEQIKGVWHGITGWWDSTVVPALQAIGGFIADAVINPIIDGVEGFINLFVRGINFLISQVNRIKLDIPDWVPAIGGQSFGINIPKLTEAQLPRLATGAVIPPNREFAAVLGDQHHGNNLEAPEGLIRQIVREESGRDYAPILQQILNAIKEGKVLMVYDDVFARVVHEAESRENSRQGMALVTVG